MDMTGSIISWSHFQWHMAIVLFKSFIQSSKMLQNFSSKKKKKFKNVKMQCFLLELCSRPTNHNRPLWWAQSRLTEAFLFLLTSHGVHDQLLRDMCNESSASKAGKTVIETVIGTVFYGFRLTVPVELLSATVIRLYFFFSFICFIFITFVISYFFYL